MLNPLKMNGAEALAQTLIENGIDVVFGIPGVSNLPFFEALRRSGIRVIPTTHEEGSAYMAYGIGRVTGKPGVFITIPGPGFTNAITPIVEALVDSTPLLGIITSAHLTGKKFQMHEIDQTHLAQSVVKSLRTVGRAADIPSTFKALLDQAVSGEPGPCLMQIPSNVFWEPIDHKVPDEDPSAIAQVPATQMDEVIGRIRSARRVGLIAGMGAADAAQQVRELAEWLNAPVVTSGSGRGVIDEAHPLSLGFGWKAESFDAVNRVLAACDLILAVGVKFSQTGTQDYRLEIKAPLIRADASAEASHENYPPEIRVTMDAREFLVRILEEKQTFGPRADDELVSMIETERRRCEARLADDRSTQLSIGDVSFSPAEFFGRLRELLPADAIIVTDAGYNERLTLQHWRVTAPRTFINPSDYESMGFAVPVAIGAAVARPDAQVVAITGDGGLVMSGLELMTAVREKINLTVIVLNNEGFGIIKQIQEEYFGVSTAVDVGAVDFRALAQSVRMNFQAPENGLTALEQALRQPGPTLLEVKMTHSKRDPWLKFKQRLRKDVKQAIQNLFG